MTKNEIPILFTNTPPRSLVDSLPSVVPLNPLQDITDIVNKLIEDYSIKLVYESISSVTEQLNQELDKKLREYRDTKKIRTFSYILKENKSNEIDITIIVTLLTDDSISLKFSVKRKYVEEIRMVKQLDNLIDDYLKEEE